MRKPHEILGVDPWCSDEELKKRFHVLAQLHHPDKGGDENTFKQISEAYRQLLATVRSDRAPQSEKSYDHGLEPMYPNDENMIVAQITATIAEIKRGKVVPLTYRRSFRCMACNGTERGSPVKFCNACNGKGYFTRTESLDATLKAT